MRKEKKNVSYYLGNFLIAFSLILLIFIYAPIISLYLNPPKIIAELPKNGFFITIPKISAQAPVIENVNPWNTDDYLPKLQNGVGEAASSKNPGEEGLIYMFAHSSDYPWRITRYNTAFFKLPDLKPGDQILLNKNGQEFTYVVYDKKELWPDQVQYLKELDENKDASLSAKLGKQLILQTCVPIGTDLKRLLVFAKLQ